MLDCVTYVAVCGLAWTVGVCVVCVDETSGACHVDDTRRRSVRTVFSRLLQNNAVPKLMTLTVCLSVVYVLLRLSVDVLHTDTLSLFGLFAVYVDTVSALVNATNGDVVASAADYNSVLLPAFTDVVHTQINNLHQLVIHFNDGLSLSLCQQIITFLLIHVIF